MYEKTYDNSENKSNKNDFESSEFSSGIDDDKGNLTTKKIEYLKKVIKDRSGEF